MTTFNLGPLSDWFRLEDGMAQLVGQPGLAERRRFDLMTTDETEVYAEDESAAPALVGVGSGLLRLRFTTVGTVNLACRSAGAVFFRRLIREPQIVGESETPSFTTLAPSGPRVSSDLQRMMFMVQLNSRRREAELAAQLAAMEARLSSAAPAAPTPAKKAETAAEAES